jgi:hypothetical protein
MEDYIFLIIAIVLSIVGALNKSKKKKTDDNPFAQKPERSKNFFMDQLLGEGFLADEEEEIKPVPKMKPAKIREPMVVAPPIVPSGHYRPGFKSSLPDRSKRNLPSSLEKPAVKESEAEPEAEDRTNYLEDFSLRKAFVYSEILQRKYE